MSTELQIGRQRYTKVICKDLPGAGNACHEYIVLPIEPLHENKMRNFAEVHFQNGPIKEAGVNGAHNEDLLAIVLDRLYSFQSGDYKCRENAFAITKIEEALHWLDHRTREREARGVEGTHKK